MSYKSYVERRSDGVQGDAHVFDVFLYTGLYQMSILSSVGPDRGKLHVSLDHGIGEIAVCDQYAPSENWNMLNVDENTLQIPLVEIVHPREYRLRVSADSKNPLSTGYLVGYQWMQPYNNGLDF